MLLLVEHRLLSGAAGAIEVSVTEAPAVYGHHADRLYVCIKPEVTVSDRSTDAVTISKERPENQPTQTTNNYIGSCRGNYKHVLTQFNKALEAFSTSFFHVLNHSPKLFILLINFIC